MADLEQEMQQVIQQDDSNLGADGFNMTLNLANQGSISNNSAV